MSDHTTKAFGFLMVFVICLLSYPSLAQTIDDNATNATLTNDVWELLDSVFGLFWSMFTILWLALALFEVVQYLQNF